MIIFIDQVSVASIIQLFFFFRDNPKNKKTVYVLDPIRKTPFFYFKKMICFLLKLKIQEELFFAGNLRDSYGECVTISANNYLSDISFSLAKKTVKNLNFSKKSLGNFDSKAFLLYLAKRYFTRLGYSNSKLVYKALICQSLADNKYKKKYMLFLHLPKGVSLKDFEGVEGFESVIPCRNLDLRFDLRKAIKVFCLLICTKAKCFFIPIVKLFRESKINKLNTLPALLTLQEDVISADKSYRSQPHWISKNDPKQNYNILILETFYNNSKAGDAEYQKKYNIYLINRLQFYFNYSNHEVRIRLNSILNRLILDLFCKKSISFGLRLEIIYFFVRAISMADFCIKNNVKSFITCENFYEDADIISFLANYLNIKTISYQYSNISEINPYMMTSAETFLAFSDMFALRWRKNGINPKINKNIGYLFSSSFELIKDRAKRKRKELLQKGSEFIICFFDESIQNDEDKYGTIGKKDHYKEIFELANAVLEDKTLSIIIKTQFYFNNPSILYLGDSVIQSAINSGRFIELSTKGHRNNIFPAEAAMISDFAIGHSVGATAGLEAAIVNKRCILLNNLGMRGSNIKIFKKGNILCLNMKQALESIKEYRLKKLGYKSLGDWNDFLPEFVKYHGNQALSRYKNEIERLTIR